MQNGESIAVLNEGEGVPPKLEEDKGASIVNGEEDEEDEEKDSNEEEEESGWVNLSLFEGRVGRGGGARLRACEVCATRK